MKQTRGTVTPKPELTPIDLYWDPCKLKQKHVDTLPCLLQPARHMAGAAEKQHKAHRLREQHR